METTHRPLATVERAVALLRALADSPTDLGNNEIARRTGLNVSTVSRLLATLVEAELVRRVPDTGRYRLGPGLVVLGHAALARIDLRGLAHEHLAVLTDLTGETATLSVPAEHTVITVDFVQSPSMVPSVARMGRPAAPHATATGKVYLAYGGEWPDGELPSYTRRTIVDRDVLSRQIATVREQGWAEAVGEREEELSAVATPVLGGDGELWGVLGLQGPAARFDDAARKTFVDHLLDHSARLATGASP